MRRKGWTLVLVVIGAVAVWQGYQLAGPAPEIDAEAREIACETTATCDDASSMQLDKTPFARRYTWTAASGAVIVECRRPYILLGDVRCTAEHHELAVGPPDKDVHAPHELRRGRVGKE